MKAILEMDEAPRTAEFDRRMRRLSITMILGGKAAEEIATGQSMTAPPLSDREHPGSDLSLVLKLAKQFTKTDKGMLQLLIRSHTRARRVLQKPRYWAATCALAEMLRQRQEIPGSEALLFMRDTIAGRKHRQ